MKNSKWLLVSAIIIAIATAPSCVKPGQSSTSDTLLAYYAAGLFGGGSSSNKTCGSCCCGCCGGCSKNTNNNKVVEDTCDLTDPALAISSGALLQVSTFDSLTPASLIGTPLPLSLARPLTTNAFASVATNTPTAIAPLGLTSSGTGAAATDITDLNSNLSIFISYFGANSISECTLNAPFDTLSCNVSANKIDFTRGTLSSIIGSGTDKTLNASVQESASCSDNIATNDLFTKKYHVGQVSNILTVGNERPRNLIIFKDPKTQKDNLFFVAGTSSLNVDGGYQEAALFKYDGTSLTRVFNFTISLLNDGETFRDSFLTVYNGKLFFSGTDASGYSKLLAYDPVNNNVAQYSYLSPNGDDGVYNMTVFKDKSGVESLFFIATSGSEGNVSGSLALYKLKFDADDMTPLITRVSDANLVLSAGFVSATMGQRSLKVFADNLFFVACKNDGNFNYKLYKYDGSTITQVSNTNASGSDFLDDDGGIPYSFTAYNGKLYFPAVVATNPKFRVKLFAYNSASSSVTQISNIAGTNADDAIMNPVVFKDSFSNTEKLYFGASSASTGNAIVKVYAYDGTKITKVSDINGSTKNDYFVFPIVYNNELLFLADNGTSTSIQNWNLIKYDGKNIAKVFNVGGIGTPHGSFTLQINLFTMPVIYNNALYFDASFAKTGDALVSKLVKLW